MRPRNVGPVAAHARDVGGDPQARDLIAGGVADLLERGERAVEVALDVAHARDAEPAARRLELRRRVGVRGERFFAAIELQRRPAAHAVAERALGPFGRDLRRFRRGQRRHALLDQAVRDLGVQRRPRTTRARALEQRARRDDDLVGRLAAVATAAQHDRHQAFPRIGGTGVEVEPLHAIDRGLEPLRVEVLLEGVGDGVEVGHVSDRVTPTTP